MDIPKRTLEEARAAAYAKHPECPHAQRLHTLLHAAVREAGRKGRGRRAIAVALGVGLDSVDRWMGPAPERVIPADHLMRLLFEPGVLGEETHAWLYEQVTGIFLDRLAPCVPGRLAHSAMEAAGSAGTLVALVGDITSAESELGERISPRERTHLDTARADAMMDLAAVRPGGEA